MAEERGVNAPYNFVSLSEVVERYEEISQLPAHNRIDEERSSGTISYEVRAELPIMINDGNGTFYKNPSGKYAIPGSSMRGLIRSNAQILGFSSVGVDVEDYRLMYRVVGQAKGNPLKERYQKILGSLEDGVKTVSYLENVQAGYLKKENGKYTICPVVSVFKRKKGKRNYYRISEKMIFEQKMEFFFKDEEPYRLQNKDIDGDYGLKNSQYHPYFQAVSFQVDQSGRKITDVADAGKPGYKQGYIISSGYIGGEKMPDSTSGKEGTATGYTRGKKIQYIIPQKDVAADAAVLEVDDKFIRNYKIDFNKKENQLGSKTREFFRLPQEGEEKPVFYIHDVDEDDNNNNNNNKNNNNGILYFGFTPHLRLYYKHGIWGGLPKRHKYDENEKDEKIILDYNRSLFGFSAKNHAYKSRLCFFDAEAEDGVLDKQESRVLAEPKPTSYWDYLEVRDKKAMTYNDEVGERGFRLRGVKQYWLHKDLVPAEPVKNKNILSTFTPLQEGTVFRGKIRFHNLSEDELGLLLWSIALNPDSVQNIGQGKSYGFGKVKIRITDVHVMDYEKMYSLDKLHLESVRKSIDNAGAVYIQAYKRFIGNKLKCDIDTMPHIVDFFLMKKADCIPGDEKTRYMKVEAYKNRTKPLPVIKQVIEQKNASRGGRNSTVDTASASKGHGAAAQDKAHFKEYSQGKSKSNEKLKRQRLQKRF